MKNLGYFFRVVLRWMAISFLISVLSCLAAGSMPPALCHYLSLFSVLLAFSMLRVHPHLFRERSQILHTSCSWPRIVTGVSFLLTVLTASWDIGRLHRFDSVPISICHASLLIFTAAIMLQIWAMAVNPFFFPEIRIQPGHKLILAGPYHVIRHPGYLAMLIAIPASALSIGSWLALLPASLFCAAILNRVQAEDNFLQNNLAGYRDYAQTIPKLLPRIPLLRRFPLRDRTVASKP